MAKPAEAPYWANTIDRGTVRASGTHFFLAVQEPNTCGLTREFILGTGMIAQHKSDGTIPSAVRTSVLRPLHSDKEFPYEDKVSTALADYALTTLAQQLGQPAQHRLRIERMDKQSWVILLDDLADIDDAPKRLESDGEQAKVDLSIISATVEAYRNCPYALDSHNDNPEEAPEELTSRKPKRFSFTKLFH